MILFTFAYIQLAVNFEEHGDGCIRWQRYIDTVMRDTSNTCLQSCLHQILFKFNRIFNSCLMTKGR